MKPAVVLLNGRRMKSPARAHTYIKWKLGFPAYYGGNLDALHDCLTDVSRDTRLVLRHADALERQLGAYAQRLLDVFADSAQENPYLALEVRPGRKKARK